MVVTGLGVPAHGELSFPAFLAKATLPQALLLMDWAG